MRTLIETVRRNMGVVPSSWFNFAPHRRMDVAFWLDVLDAVHEAGIAPLDATSDDIKAAIQRIDQKAVDVRAQAAAKRQEAEALRAQADEIEQAGLPRHVLRAKAPVRRK